MVCAEPVSSLDDHSISENIMAHIHTSLQMQPKEDSVFSMEEVGTNRWTSLFTSSQSSDFLRGDTAVSINNAHCLGCHKNVFSQHSRKVF